MYTAFMYTGRLDDAESDFDRLLVADHFQIDALKDIIKEGRNKKESTSNRTSKSLESQGTTLFFPKLG